MPTGIAFMKWTDQGVHTMRETVDRFEHANKLAGRFAVEIKEIFWTPGGPYDIVSVAEGKDGKGLAAFVLALESLGNLRITLTEGYRPDEMRKLIAKRG